MPYKEGGQKEGESGKRCTVDGVGERAGSGGRARRVKTPILFLLPNCEKIRGGGNRGGRGSQTAAEKVRETTTQRGEEKRFKGGASSVTKPRTGEVTREKFKPRTRKDWGSKKAPSHKHERNRERNKKESRKSVHLAHQLTMNSERGKRQGKEGGIREGKKRVEEARRQTCSRKEREKERRLQHENVKRERLSSASWCHRRYAKGEKKKK